MKKEKPIKQLFRQIKIQRQHIFERIIFKVPSKQSYLFKSTASIRLALN
jgi:hypothetical protein